MFRISRIAENPENAFSGKALLRLILPLIAEQFLAVLVGMADTVMVSGVGESAVAAISTVDSINTLFIQLFSAMSAGGAVVAAQYLGRKDLKNACQAAKQLMLSTFAISFIIMSLTLIFYRQIMGIMDDGSDPETLRQSYTYLLITACSFPALGLYNGGVGLMRAMGNSKASMWTSTAMNLINICGNALLIHPMGLGVAGAALSTLLSRTVSAIIIIRLLFDQSAPIHLGPIAHWKQDLRPDFSMIRRIFNIGIPSGLENSLFQVGKVLIMSIVTTFSTSLRAANGVANTLCGLPNIPGNAIGLASITVIGQLVGAGDKEAARRYANKLLLLTIIGIIPLNLVMLFAAPQLVQLFSLSGEGMPVAARMLQTYAVCSFVIWAPSWRLPDFLHAAGDVRFPMVVSMLCMLVLRVGASYLFVYGFGWSLMGIWYAMFADWLARAVCFIIRFRGDKWLNKKVI